MESSRTLFLISFFGVQESLKYVSLLFPEPDEIHALVQQIVRRLKLTSSCIFDTMTTYEDRTIYLYIMENERIMIEISQVPLLQNRNAGVD